MLRTLLVRGQRKNGKPVIRETDQEYTPSGLLSIREISLGRVTVGFDHSLKPRERKTVLEAVHRFKESLYPSGYTSLDSMGRGNEGSVYPVNENFVVKHEVESLMQPNPRYRLRRNEGIRHANLPGADVPRHYGYVQVHKPSGDEIYYLMDRVHGRTVDERRNEPGLLTQFRRFRRQSVRYAQQNIETASGVPALNYEFHRKNVIIDDANGTKWIVDQ